MNEIKSIINILVRILNMPFTVAGFRFTFVNIILFMFAVALIIWFIRGLME